MRKALRSPQQTFPLTSRWLNLGHTLIYTLITVVQKMELLWMVKTNQDPTWAGGFLGGTVET